MIRRAQGRAERRAATVTIVAQPYPLWCAELRGDGTVRLGRIVAWTLDGQVPHIAWEDGATRRPLIDAGGPKPGNPLFVAENRERAQVLARRVAADDGPAPLDRGSVAWWEQ
jgi:hypothetical protein